MRRIRLCVGARGRPLTDLAAIRTIPAVTFPFNVYAASCDTPSWRAVATRSGQARIPCGAARGAYVGRWSARKVRHSPPEPASALPSCVNARLRSRSRACLAAGHDSIGCREIGVRGRSAAEIRARPTARAHCCTLPTSLFDGRGFAMRKLVEISSTRFWGWHSVLSVSINDDNGACSGKNTFQLSRNRPTLRTDRGRTRSQRP